MGETRFSKWNSCVRVILSAVFALLLIPATGLRAQTVTGTILGNILDASGSAVPSSEITITNQDTGVVRTAVGTADGVYSVPSLLPGKYTVEAKAQGFSPTQVKDVVVNVGSDSRVDLKLAVGSTTQTVTVTEAIPTVETTSSEVSQVMDQDLIKDIPLNARDLQQLAEIQPGVQYNYYSSYGKQLSIIGDRPTHNRYLQEGIDMTWTYRTGPQSLPTSDGIMLGVEAVKEFKVLSTDFSAEYGELSGGTISMLFKSGTNQIHGSAYEYFRDSAFDARNFFDKTTGAPPLTRHQFGASLGGPIKKDNTFFFLNYEGYRLSLSESFLADEPDLTSRGNAVPAIQNIFFGGAGGNGPNPLLPVCNGGPLGGGLCQFFSNPVQTIDENYGVVKIDHSFGTKNTLSASYNNDYTQEYLPANYAAAADDQTFHRQTFTVQDTHIFSPNVVNTARFGVNRINYVYVLDNVANIPVNSPLFVDSNPIYTPCASKCGPNGKAFPQVPVITVSGGFTAFGVGASGQTYAPRWIGYTGGLASDDVNYQRGKHSFQFGFQAKKWNDDLNINSSFSRGTFAFQNLNQFLQGGTIPTSVPGGAGPVQTFTWSIQNLQNFPTAGTTTASDFGRTWHLYSYGTYAEDTYKIKSNLTLTYGLRWEYVPGPTESHGRVSTVYNPTPLQSPGAAVTSSYYTPPKDNFAPRLGFNWDPFKTGKTSVRGGFGVFFNEIEDDTWYAGPYTNPPFTYTVTLSNLAGVTLPFNTAVLQNQTNIKQGYGAAIQPESKTPTKYGYNISIQQELPDHMSLMIAYVGAQSRHLGRYYIWQDFAPTGTEVPGQLPTLNGQVIPGSTINPACNAAGEVACLYWAGVGASNANTIGNNGGTFTPTVANPTAAYATLCGGGVNTKCLPNNNFSSSLTGTTFDGNATYNSFQTALERRMSPGLYARFNYTYARCISDAADDLFGGSTNGGSGGEIIDAQANSSRGRCSFQGTNAANLTLAYDSPFGKMVSSKWAKAIVSAWLLSTQTTVTSGTPFNVTNGVNVARYAASGNGLDRPNWAPGCNAQNAITNPRNAANTYVNDSCFVPAPYGYQGNVGALILTGPALWDTDISLKRTFPLRREGMSLTVGADMFNAFNRANFSAPTGATLFLNSASGTSLVPSTTIGAAGSATNPNIIRNPNAGQILSTVTTSRQFQISGRFTF